MPDRDKFYIFGNGMVSRMGIHRVLIKKITLPYFAPPPNVHVHPHGKEQKYTLE